MLQQRGGPSYAIPVGRRDARAPSPARTTDLPAFFEDLNLLSAKFKSKRFTNGRALSGAHTAKPVVHYLGTEYTMKPTLILVIRD
ncbi:hypothetical protein IFM89_010539 [Coptis chinensis]|uniref:Plant heme peroxidase family profile domain-containing protein n=1 Tax=Coptis chinensis TaxID=261450 RepID=A0A835IXD3_9MAGN|nr:hypothetical protein IFM89_010539 [Coptis chinensis]